MQRSYSSEVPYRQFWGRRADSAFSLNEAQDGMLHQLLGVCTGFGGYLRKLRFLLGREMYFHVSRLRNNRLRSNARYPATFHKFCRIQKLPILFKNSIAPGVEAV